MEINLKKFCSVKKPRSLEPMSNKKYTFATNGHFAVRVPRIKEITKPTPEKMFNKLCWQPKHDGEWVEMPWYSRPHKIKCLTCNGAGFEKECPECKGDGEISFENEFSCYEIECMTCVGEGSVSGNENDEICENCEGEGVAYPRLEKSVVLHDTKLNINLLDKLKPLPNIRLFFPAYENSINFKFDGGVGVLMIMAD